MKLKMRLLCLLLAVVMVVGLVPTVMAEESVTPTLNYRSGGTREIDLIKNTATSPMGKYLTNDTVISPEYITALAGDNNTANLDIYAFPGMAVGFASGTTWQDGSWNLEKSNNGDYKHENWEWVWNGTVNYAVLPNQVNPQAKAKFKLEVGDITCNVCVHISGSVTLMRDAIASSPENIKSRYTIKDVDATLYNYDGSAFNKYYDAQGSNYFAFSGTVLGVNTRDSLTNISWTTSGAAANGGGGVALMGIVNEQMVNGLPTMSQGQQVDLFSSSNAPGKTVYNNVDFEFIFDNETGYYTYNSELNHAQYNSVTNKIELYKESLSPVDSSHTTGNNSKAGFYPFTDIHKAFNHSSAPNLTLEAKLQKLEIGVDENNRLFADMAKDLNATSSEVGSTVDMHFAVQIDETFYLPNGKTLNGEEMLYEFTGDDDLWVFIDGQLVLDIGGGHTPVSGSFNLTTGQVKIDKYSQLSAANGGFYETQVTGGSNLEYTSSVLTNLAEDQMHRIQIFYMERHSGESNCRMRFNLPLVPENIVMVSKELFNDEGTTDFAVTPDVSYTFAIYTAVGNTDTPIEDKAQFAPLSNKEYTIIGGSSGRTNEQGEFTLQAGQVAAFEGIERFTNVYVVESEPDDRYEYITPKVAVNDGNAVAYTYGTDSQILVMPNDSIKFSFTNYIQTYDLTVAKEIINKDGAQIAGETKYPVSVLIEGTEFQNDIAIGESITIEHIPAGLDYSVTEGTLPEAPYGFEYKDPVYSNATGTIVADTEVTITNELVAILADLKIIKTGIDPIDYHETNGSSKQERQSTLYEISGTTAAGEPFYLEVSINGITAEDNFVLIKNLPVGTYTVKEKTSWSWRYTVDTVSVTKGEKIDETITDGVKVKHTGTGTEVTFNNNRSKIYWLSGDNFWRNLFDGNKTQSPAPIPTPTVSTD